LILSNASFNQKKSTVITKKHICAKMN